VGAASTGDHMLGAAERGEFGLKCAHLGPENELAMAENTGDRGIDRDTKTSALRTNVNKRNRRRIGSKIHQTVRVKQPRRSTCDRARPFPLRGRDLGGTSGETLRRDLEAGHTFLAGHGRRRTGADRTQECEQFRTKRLRMADRKMPPPLTS